jgi:hypothetical protein
MGRERTGCVYLCRTPVSAPYGCPDRGLVRRGATRSDRAFPDCDAEYVASAGSETVGRRRRRTIESLLPADDLMNRLKQLIPTDSSGMGLIAGKTWLIPPLMLSLGFCGGQLATASRRAALLSDCTEHSRDSAGYFHVISILFRKLGLSNYTPTWGSTQTQAGCVHEKRTVS